MIAGLFIAISVTIYYSIKTNVSGDPTALGIFNIFGPFLFTIGLATLSFFGAELLTSGMMYTGIGKYYNTVKT
jgi:formate/nitrite transporter FocA (FNT family)